jgi:hypothetical protein
LQEFSSVPKKRFMKVTYVEEDIAKEGLGMSTEHHGLLMTNHISHIPYQRFSELPGHASGSDEDECLASD